MKKGPFKIKFKDGKAPLWGLFIFLFLLHLFASDPRSNLLMRQIVWGLGILGTFLWFLPRRSEAEPSHLVPPKFFFPDGVWVLLILGGIFLRSFRLWAVPAWPQGDESVTFQAAMELSKGWDGSFFYGPGQSAPLLNWVSGALFKGFQNVFLSILIPPFIVSTLTLLLVAWTARRVSPGAPGFLWAAFYALSFWPIYIQSFDVQATLLLLWEIATLYLFLRTKEQLEKGRGGFYSIFLGFWTGSGYWTYEPWFLVAFGVAMVLAWSIPHGLNRVRSMIRFGLGFLLAFLPFLYLTWVSGGYGIHLIGFSALSGWFTLKETLVSSLDYFNSIFWGHWSSGIYLPDRGGFLGPLLAASFWLGVLEVLKRKEGPPLGRWGGLLSLLFLAPGVLSHNLQGLRIIQFLPLALGFCALGASQLIPSIFNWRSRALLFLLLVLLGSWDGVRYLEEWKNGSAEKENVRSLYGSISRMAQDQGPGLCFTQFKITDFDQRDLDSAVFPFNAAANEDLDLHLSRWAVLLVHPDEVPFFKGEFPLIQWRIWPSSNGEGPGTAVGFFPILAREGPRLENWVRAEKWFQKADLKLINTYNSRSFQEAQTFWLSPPFLKEKDRFLQACYWEKLAHFYYYRGYESHYSLQVDALRNAVVRGFPAAHLTYELGSLLLRRKSFQEAREFLRAAQKADPRDPEIGNALKLLEHMEKDSRTLSREK
jgi:tetratricopeptide (TPR) repeat protein